VVTVIIFTTERVLQP